MGDKVYKPIIKKEGSHLLKSKENPDRVSGNKRLIIDTKYYSHTMQVNSQYDSRTFVSGNMYQIFTYVKNSDIERAGNVAGVLLYAKTDEDITPNSDFNMGGNRISVKTLDLNRDWNEITEQLERLCGWLQAA